MQIIYENAADKMNKTSLRTTVLLSASHVVNDSYMNLFPPLLPFIMPSLGLTVSSIGWLMTFFSVTSSLSQLAIGYLSDRIGGRFFIIMGPLVAAIFMSSLGIITNYYFLIIAVSVAGLGTAAFHPPSSALIGSLNESKSGRLMSLFTLGGNLGWAIMPILAVPLVSRFGLSITPVLAIPGIAVAVLLFLFVPHLKANRSYLNQSLLKIAIKRPLPFLCLLGSVAFRSLAFFSLVAFLPKYLSDLGFSALSSGMMLSILTLSGAFGGLIGGVISDNIGRKSVIAGSLACSTPFLFIFQATGGWLAGLWLFFAGAFILASFSVTVVAAQEIMPDNKATASSLALGFGLGLGGLGVGLLGHIATAIGLEHTVLLIAFLPLVASALSLGLPGKAGARVRNF